MLPALHQDIAAAGIDPFGDHPDGRTCLARRILRAIDEAAQITLLDPAEAMDLLLDHDGVAEGSQRRLSQLFATDPTLAAQLLREANAPAHGAQGQVHAIAEALALLGVQPLRALVARAAVGPRSVPGVDLPQFWRYSLHAAKMARSLAGLVRHNQLAAYTAGLLHALGELALHLADPERMQSINTLVLPMDLRRAKLEQRLLGYAYGQVGAGLAQQWGLPALVVHALGWQHAPFDDQVYEPLAGVVHLAGWRARATEAALTERELAVSFPDQVGLALGLDIDMVLQQDPIDWTPRPDLDESDIFV